MKSKMKQAINSIQKLLENETLYYSTDENTYFMGFHGGMGNFELFRLPIAWTGLFVYQEVENEMVTTIVTGTYRQDGQPSDDVNAHEVQIQKVISAQLSLKGKM